MDHVDRYVLAQFDAHVAIGKDHGLKERAVLRNLVGIAIGAVVLTPDNLARMFGGLPFHVGTPPLRLPPKELKRDRVEDERYRNAFAPYLDDLRRQLHKLRTRDDARGVWHRVMACVLPLFIEGDVAKIEEARRLAASVGEGDFFENELFPLMIAGAERRAEQNGP